MLFVSQKTDRGGSVYEEEVRRVLEDDYDIEVLELNFKKNKILQFTKLKYYYQVNSYKTDKKHNIIIANKESIYAGILKKNIQKKLLIFHHYFNEENRYPVLRRLLKKSLISNLNKFDYIVVVAEYWKKFVSRYADENKVHVVYNSFDTVRINGIKHSLNKVGFREKFKIPGDKIIVYGGNALKIKGYEKVLHLLDKNKYFVITSGSSDAKKPLQHLHLSLNYEEYIQLLCTADITVILSDFHEGWNRIAHESLICGTPVVGTDIAGMGELLHKAGQMIYEEGASLDELITQSLNDKDLPKRGEKYASQFNLAYFSEKWRTIISAVDNAGESI